jgi:PHP family Zn ribbon phosphoesterase
MKIAYDLHIHSALSPCGDNDMTPNNIVNMSFIKGLKLISITDHNSMLNVLPAIQVARKYDILVIPGIEVTTREEIHVLCYFSDLSEGMRFQDLIYESLPDIDNREDLFGSQLIFNNNDEVTGRLKKLLLNSTNYTIEEIYELVERYNGVMIPAHIDKSSYSIISSLGFIPDSLKVRSIEVYNKSRFEKLNSFISTNKYKIINNSDAHYLTDIKEPVSFLNIEALTTEAVISYLNSMGE